MPGHHPYILLRSVLVRTACACPFFFFPLSLTSRSLSSYVGYLPPLPAFLFWRTESFRTRRKASWKSSQFCSNLPRRSHPTITWTASSSPSSLSGSWFHSMPGPHSSRSQGSLQSRLLLILMSLTISSPMVSTSSSNASLLVSPIFQCCHQCFQHIEDDIQLYI